MAIWDAWIGLTAACALLLPLGIALAAFGDGAIRSVGIGLMIAVAVIYLTPASVILEARVRRRETRERVGEAGAIEQGD